MKVFSPDKIRNVALVGHSGSGKTTLAEALLFRAGKIQRLGTVEDGNTVTDFDEEERARGMSLSLAMAPFEWKGHKINLIDTPGYVDFAGDIHAAMSVAGLAIFVVSAVEGIEVQTEYAWRVAEELGVSRMVFINKLDKEQASFERTLAELRDKFGAGIAPVELPIGIGPSFHGVADLFRDQAWIYDSGHAEVSDMPEEMVDREHEVHDNLVEGIVVADEDMLEAYLEGEVPSVEELEHTMAKGINEASVFPVVCGSATGPIAVDRLADFIVELGPSPVDRPPRDVSAGDTHVDVACDPDGEPLAFVFKTVADPYVGQISMFRVISGRVTPEMHLVNSRNGQDERLSRIATMIGKETDLVDALPAGDIGAVTKLIDTKTGDTLAPKGSPVRLPAIGGPDPVLAQALVPRTQADEDKLANAIHRVLDEDPALRLERSDETHQTLLWGMGETHLAITVEKLRRKFGVEVDTEPMKVAFRETISRPAAAEGKHKKQSGGHGQFGVCQLELEPLPRGTGFVFDDQIKGGSIPRQFIPAVEKGVMETMSEGGVNGFPVVDVRVRLVDGKYHSVDSSEMAFKMAGRLGFRAAMAAGGPVLLEPISRIEIVVPAEYQGDIMGDLASRRGQVQGSETNRDGRQVIIGQVPTSEIVTYANELRSITQGWGRFSATHDHYQEMPSHLAAKAVAEAQED
ncbi:MAG: elongation factor G [Acidimicrobiia bacterium]|nr:elongation factor G [Acidimicrobiia bacterium]